MTAVVTSSGGVEALDAVPRSAWPRIADEDFEVARQLAQRVQERRADQAASVRDEERLHHEVAEVIRDAIASPAASGLSLSVVAELMRNEGYRERAHRNAAMLASHLYPLSLLLYGADLENITCLAPDHWLVSAAGRKLSLVSGGPFASDEDVLEFFRRVLRLRGVTGDQNITDASPVAEANVGSVVRLCIAKRPAVSGRSGVQVAIRIPARSKVLSLQDYVTQLVMPAGVARFLEACVWGRANLLIAGGTASGKTTLLRVLCGMVPEDEHIVVVEDGAELHLDQPRGDGACWHELTTPLSTIPSVRADAEEFRLSMFDLVRHALRFQPDRLVLGESRGDEMAAVCKALMTGHDGSMTTVHAEDAELALEQAVQYVMENQRFSNNEKLARRIVEHAVHVVVHLSHRGGTRRVSGVLAVERGGNHHWVYRRSVVAGLERRCQLVGDLGRLAQRVEPWLGSEVPDI